MKYSHRQQLPNPEFPNPKLAASMKPLLTKQARSRETTKFQVSERLDLLATSFLPTFLLQHPFTVTSKSTHSLNIDSSTTWFAAGGVWEVVLFVALPMLGSLLGRVWMVLGSDGFDGIPHRAIL